MQARLSEGDSPESTVDQLVPVLLPVPEKKLRKFLSEAYEQAYDRR